MRLLITDNLSIFQIQITKLVFLVRYSFFKGQEFWQHNK
jgi:hypothetical protein